MPPEQWPPIGCLTIVPSRVLRSQGFLVQIFEKPTATRLSVCRTEPDKNGGWKEGIMWEELMEVKRQAGYAACCAVEFYPPDDDIVNVANMRHLWVLSSGQTLLPEYWRKKK